MTQALAAQIVVCAGGLGTRVSPWSRHIPKEFSAVAGRPGILHLLDELTALAPARVIVVYHPFYEPFINWARLTLSRGGFAAYQRAAGLPRTDLPLYEELDLQFIPQRGRYADTTSVLNAAELLRPGDLFVAFADNLYPHDNAALALSRVPAGRSAVLVRPYQRAAVGSRGVVISQWHQGELLVADLIEKPGPAQALDLETSYGRQNLWLLEGRFRLARSLISQLGSVATRQVREPKLSLAIRDHARTEFVLAVTTHSSVIDLGSQLPTSTLGAPRMSSLESGLVTADDDGSNRDSNTDARRKSPQVSVADFDSTTSVLG